MKKLESIALRRRFIACCAIVGLVAVGLGVLFGPTARPLEAPKAHVSQRARDLPPLARASRTVRSQLKSDRGFAGEPARLPLGFEMNVGQTHPKVKFLSRGAGYEMFLTSDEMVLVTFSRQSSVTNPERVRTLSEQRPMTNAFAPPLIQDLGTTLRLSERTAPVPASHAGSVFRMELVGANPNVEVAGVDECPGRSNYFIENNPKHWRTNVPNYSKVIYGNVYPGVDLVYYGNQQQLEYDFVLAPGADPNSIHLTFPGAAGLRVDAATGDLVLAADDGEVRFRRPLVYQPATAGDRAPGDSTMLTTRGSLKGDFVLTAGNQVRFQLSKYDRTKALIVDPTLVYSTYFGGSYEDYGSAIAIDASGDAYITSSVHSTNFPVFPNPGAAQPQNNGDWDVGITKFDPTKSGAASLVYSTYLGGSNHEDARDVVVNSAGNAYVIGDTQSSDFPIFPATGAFQPTFGGGIDAFVTKLNSTGTAFLYSTYLGGSGDESGAGIALDAADNVYVTGTTVSTNFPTTASAFSQTCGTDGNCNGGNSDAFLTELRLSGSGTADLIYSTYLGGEGNDGGGGVTVDTSGKVRLSGETWSTQFPVTSNGLQTEYGGGGDAFMTIIDPSKSGAASLVYSTYLGGENEDGAAQWGIAVDSAGNTYLSGFTNSANFPTTPGAFGTQFCISASCTGPHAFVAKINPGGSGLVYSTFLAGSSPDYAAGIAVDSTGSVYVTGNTRSVDFPTQNPTQSACASCASGTRDAFVTRLTPDGTALVFSTFLGGSRDDIGDGIAADSLGNAYVCGWTQSTDFPTLAQAYQSQMPDSWASAFFTKILTGPGSAVPIATLSSTTLTFSAEEIGQSSAAQTVTLNNTGNASLTISGITATGDFSQTNTCGTSVSAEAGCTISVIFEPTAVGTRTGTLSIADNAAQSPQTVALSGTGQDFTVAPPSGSTTTATVSPGQPATYTLSVEGEGGFNQAVSFTCTGDSLRIHLLGFA